MLTLTSYSPVHHIEVWSWTVRTAEQKLQKGANSSHSRHTSPLALLRSQQLRLRTSYSRYQYCQLHTTTSPKGYAIL